MRHIFLILAVNLLLVNTYSQQNDPEKVRLISSDIVNFWTAYDSAVRDTSKATQVIETLYLGKGSYGLKKFDELSIRGAGNLANAIRQHRRFYESIRSNTIQAIKFEKQICQLFKNLQSLISVKTFPDVYFLIGNLNSGGKSTDSALLIGVEIFSADSQTVFDNFDSVFKKLVLSFSLNNIPQIVAHELIHYQQSYADSDKDLLGYAIMEGSADFIAELISGIKSNVLLHKYGEQHEHEWWMEFEKDMHLYDLSRWMYSAASNNRPADRGYYIGYKIVESYYRNSGDKKQAIQDILNVKDFSKFLYNSKYMR